MNSKKTAAAAGIILCTAFMTGCFPTVGAGTTEAPGKTSVSEGSESVSEQSDTPTASDFPEHIVSRNVDRLNIDADVILPAEFDPTVKTASASAAFKVWNTDAMLSFFTENHTVTDETTSENTGPDDLIHVYTLDDDSDVVFSDGDFWYSTVAEKEFEYAYYFDEFDNYIRPETLPELFGTADISGLVKNEALQQTRTILDIAQISDRTGQPQVSTISSETVNRMLTENSSADKSGNPVQQWTSAQDAYLIVYPLLYTGLPSLQLNAMGENTLYNNANIWFIYGQNGLISCKLISITDLPAAENAAPLLSPYDVAAKIEDFFHDIIIDAPLNISLMKLGYLTETTFDDPKSARLIPVWMICGEFEGDDAEVTEKDEKSVSQQGKTYLALINAVTGESLPISSIGGL